MTINKGRWAASSDQEIVVFLIGMRINKFWKVHKWGPVAMAMPKMLKWLDKNPQAGLLAYDQVVRSPRQVVVLQYWRSFEDLERFARDAQAPHLGPWKSFNAKVRDSGDVGIWHETYVVEPGRSESIFGNMPPRGLAAFADLRPVGSTAATAAKRIGARDEDEAPVAGY